MSTNSNLRIVGIGASAGGLQALEAFFKDVPVDSGVTFVIIQHLSPDHKTMMPSLLGRITDIPINLADNGMPLEKNHIYLIPAKKNIVLEDDTLTFINRAPLNKLNLSIDIFFNSLANEKKEKAIGVILSGTGSDGTKGGQNIKEVGGTMFIQDPTSIRFTGMPTNAISAGIADYILTMDELPKEILNYVDLIYNKYQTLQEEDKESIEDILLLLKKKGGNDFTSYRRQTLNRRLIKRMNLNKIDSIHDYKILLESSPEEQSLLTNEFLINVTEFFRDTQHFKVLEKSVIPAICRNDHRGEIKAWSIACSTGEEAYSVAILITEFLETNNIAKSFKVFATDIDEEALDIASKGIYNERIISDIKPEFLSKYFKRKNNTYVVQPSLRKNIIFSLHNIMSNPPFSKMDLISCRNMLIYLEPEAQKRVFRNMAYALNVNGYLFLGASESANILGDHFKPIHKKAKIFQKEKDFAESSEAYAITNRKYHTTNQKLKVEADTRLADVSIKALSSLTDSICVVFDTSFDIIKLYGDFNKIATFPKDGFDLQVLKLNRLLPKEFNVPVTSSMSTLKNDYETTVKKTIVYKKGEKSHMATFSLNHLRTKKGYLENYYLLVINGLQQEWDSKNERQKAITAGNQEDLILIEQMLDDTRENLQLTIEELEASNEEAQATNEELVSSNEELQSTNEELQSVNEELNTVNVELEQRNVQLLELNADFENLINSSGTINLFLDKEFKLRNYTQSILPIFNFLETDIGRDLKNFSLPYPELLSDVAQVIKSLRSIEREVFIQAPTNEDKVYLQAIHPYRTAQDEIKGVVINYSDITNIKSTNTLLSSIIHASPGLIYVYNLKDKKNEYASPITTSLAGYTPDELKEMGTEMMAKLIHPDDFAKITDHQENIINSDTDEIRIIDYRLIKKGTTADDPNPCYIESHDVPVKRDANNKVTKICGIALEVTDLKTTQLELKKQNALLSHVTSISPFHIMISTVAPEKISFTNDTFIKSLGYDIDADKRGNNPRQVLKQIMPIAEFKSLTGLFDDIVELNLQDSFEIEVQVYDSNELARWFMWRCMPYEWTESGKIKSIIHFVQEITELKENQIKLQSINKELEEFTYVSSHDLQQPLNTIQSSIKILQKELKDHTGSPLIERCLTMVADTSTSMKQSIKSILDYSKVESDVSFHTVNLNEVLKSVVTSLDSAIQEGRAKLNIKSDLPKIKGDAQLIRLVFQNLITNAIKFQKKGQHAVLDIEHEQTNTHEIIHFKDNGIGISEKQQSRIFTLFQRLHEESEYEGSGIGLAHANKIMRIHGGNIEVSSTVGEGSTFSCFFLKGK